MVLTAVLNALLALGVLVLVITPLVWAIVTQRDPTQRSGDAPERAELRSSRRVAARTPQPRRAETRPPSAASTA